MDPSLPRKLSNQSENDAGGGSLDFIMNNLSNASWGNFGGDALVLDRRVFALLLYDVGLLEASRLVCCRNIWFIEVVDLPFLAALNGCII
jgi:hypothetical protein